MTQRQKAKIKLMWDQAIIPWRNYS